MATKTEKDLWVKMSIREISTQAHFARIAYRHLNPQNISDTDTTYISIHSFFSHCAMISKMLKSKSDGSSSKSIGDILGVDDNSPIHKRKFRNHLEHNDQRLKKWIIKYGANINIGTYNVGSKTAIQIPGLIYISNYDPTTQTFTFVDEDFELKPLFTESQRIKDIADKWVGEMQRGSITPPFC